MIDRLIETSVRQRLLFVLLFVGLTGWGAYSYQRIPIGAFPEITNNQVQVLTSVPGMSPVEIEKLVTRPVEINMASLPDVVENRSISQFGLSSVTIVFADDVDPYFARQLVFQRLSEVQDQLPDRAEAEMAPLATGLSQIYEFTVRDAAGDGRAYSPMELRTLLDWEIVPALRGARGVVEVNAQGGYAKQYQVRLNPEAMLNLGVTLGEVYQAVAASNENAGGQYIVRGDEQLIVRGVGRLGEEEAVREGLRNTVVAAREGTPVRVGDVAAVEVGAAARYGAVVANGEGEAVNGTVMMRRGANVRAVVTAVEAELDAVRAALPSGVVIDTYYDRTTLVQAAISTVTQALLIGALLVVVVLVVFLGDWRAALIVSLVLPMTALITFILMDQFGFGANLMSLGGLAIGIGMFVDGSIVMVENIYRLRRDEPERPLPEVVMQAGREVGRPIAFAVGVVITVFLPLFTLQQLEGRMFRPLAFTLSFALLAALFLALTMAPALSTYLLGLSGKKRSEAEEGEDGASEEKNQDNWVVRQSERLYRPVLKAALSCRRWTAALAALAVVGAGLLFQVLGSEFVPRLEEGAIALSVGRVPSISLAASVDLETEMQRAAMDFPEVTTIVSKVGRAEVATDPNPQNVSDVFVGLAPRSEWRFGSKEALVEALRERFEDLPGLAVNFSQPIQLRVDELISGVKSQIAIKIYGPDLPTLERLGGQVAGAVRRVPGAADVAAEQVSGLGYLEVRLRRARAARYGISAGDVQRLVETAIGGAAATEVIDGNRRFGVLVRVEAEDRATAQDIRSLRLDTPTGQRVRLQDVADVRVVEGPAQVSHEDGARLLVVQSNVTGRSIGRFVADAQAAVRQQVDLPPGYRVTWGGQFENQQRAQQRLLLIIPVTLVIVFVLLYITFGALRQAALVLLNVPPSVVGGVVALWLLGENTSVPASVGFIAVLGIAVQNGIVMISFINDLRAQGRSVTEAVREGAVLRLRPILMTSATTLLGLIPLLFATGIGAGVQRPLAAVVVGGLFTSGAATLLLLPALYQWFAKTSHAA